VCCTEGEVKINVDATYNSDEGRGSAGVVIQDYKGKCIATLIKDIFHLCRIQYG
jgi:hypothetical protein